PQHGGVLLATPPDPRGLRSFPTRRSSDLLAGVPTGAPNVLLLVPGRRSGIERPMPVTVLDFEGHTYVQATYGASGWGRNLKAAEDRKSTRLNSSHVAISYAVFCLKKKN